MKSDQTRLDNTEETLLQNNVLLSLFSKREVYQNNEQVFMCFVKCFSENKDETIFHGPLAIGLFAREPLLLPNFNFELKIIRSSQALYLINTAGLISEALILNAFVFTRQVAMSDNWIKNFKSGLLREPAIFYSNEELPKTFFPRSSLIKKIIFKHNNSNYWHCYESE